MPDLTIHDIDDAVLQRLQRDAQANDQTPEDVALHILTNWHGLLKWHDDVIEQNLQIKERVEKMPAIPSPEQDAKLKELKAHLEMAKRRANKPGEERADQ